MSSKDETKKTEPDLKFKEIEGGLQSLLEDLLETKYVKHAVIALEKGDGSFSWIGVEGKADPDWNPMQWDTPFWIASVTKLFIAAAILKLHEEKSLSIEDSMAAYLPQDLIQGLHRWKDGKDYTNEITLLHLLGHSSGLPDYLEVHPRGEKSLYDIVLEEGDSSWTIREILKIIKEVNKPHFPPQSLQSRKKRIRYSDTNYQLLIAVIQAVTGKTLHEVFQKMFYGPLDLKETFHPGEKPLGSTLPPAAVWYQDRPLFIPKAMKSFGDLNSTAKDLLKFMRALIGGQVFQEPATGDLMVGEWNRFGFSVSPVGPGWPIEYGLGMMRFRMPRLITPLRPLPEVIGHTGACGSWLFYCPSLDMYLTGTVSQVTASPVPFRFLPKVLSFLKSKFNSQELGILP